MSLISTIGSSSLLSRPRIALKYREATRGNPSRTHTRSRIECARVRVHDDILASFRAMGSHEDALACLVILLTGPQQFYISREGSNENSGVVVPRCFFRCFFRGRTSRAIWLSFPLSLSFSLCHSLVLALSLCWNILPPSLFPPSKSHRWRLSLSAIFSFMLSLTRGVVHSRKALYKLYFFTKLKRDF